MSSPEKKVLLDKNLLRIILEHAMNINDLKTNYLLIYNGSLVCKKWRNLIFRWFVAHFKKYNYKEEQFNYDNIISMGRSIERNYFESNLNSPYKQPNIATKTVYRLTKPKYYAILLEHSSNLKKSQQYLESKFIKLPRSKMCKVCSTITQCQILCGNYLNKIRLKKLEIKKQQEEKENE